jgi:hypothetical protein
MLKTKRSIDTCYAGYKFRSRTEARWAVFLNNAGIAYEYEREGYSLPSGCYLPDFWLTDWNAWIEVKGEKPTATEIKLCEELAHHTDAICILCVGQPGMSRPRVYCSDSTDSSGGTGWWDMDFTTDGDVVRLDCCDRRNDRGFMTPNWSCLAVPFIGFTGQATIFHHNLAILAARRARFEFGESPK